MKASSQENFRTTIMATSFAEAGMMLMKVLSAILLARALGPFARGEFSLALLIPGLFITLTSLGVGEASATLIGNGRYPREQIVGCLLTYVIALSLLLAAVYFGCSRLILSLFKHNVGFTTYALAFFYIPINLIWFAISPVLLGLGVVKQISWGRLFNNALFLAALAAIALTHGLTPLLAVCVFLIAGALELAYLYFFVKKHVRLTPYFDRAILKDQLRFGWSLFFQTVFGQLNRRMDSYLVVYLMGNYGLGIYTVAASLTEFMLALPTVVSRVAFSVSVQPGSADRMSLAAASVRQIFFFLAVVAVFMAVFMKPLILVFYSERFIEALVPALLLLPGIIAFGLNIVMGYILIGRGDPKKMTIAAGLSCAVTIVLDLLLIPRFGLPGASIASTIAYATGSVYLISVFTGKYGIPLKELLLVTSADIGGYLKDLLSAARRFGSRAEERNIL